MTLAIPARKRKRRSRLRQIFAAIQLLVLSAFAIGLVFTAVTIWNLSSVLPQGAGAIGEIDPIESTKIFSADGYELATIYMDEHREYVPLSRMPEHLRNATIATEDKRFYDHNGVDFRGIGRALVEDVKTRERAQGGSTITQQLVRNVYLTRRKSVGRKIQEALLAVQIERKYSKDDILEKYLNQVFYGSGAYGVQAAARTYFGKKVGELTLAECALLAGLPQRPTGYSPYKSQEAAKKRRNVVLALMAQEGYITQAQKINAQAAPIKLPFRRASGARIRRAPFFVDYVLDDLIDRYGANTVYKGGLRVYTTLHTTMQAVADKALRDGVKGMRNQNVSQGALLSLDPRTGYIRAMVGGVNYQKSQLNRAYLEKHPRSPGSAFKPFVFAAAFENGASPYDHITDEPISIDDGSSKPWQPRNYDDKWMGGMTIENAVAQSRNIPAIKTIQKVGIGKTVEVARRLGIESELSKVLSLAIGVSGVTMVELAAAYGAFANDGIYAKPIAIMKIMDRDGNVLEVNKPQVKKALRTDVQRKVDQCLRAVTTKGTALKAGRAIALARGKTGTAQEDRDAWFVGYVPKQLVTAVWVGNDDNSEMRRVFGGTNVSPIWIEYMEKALKLNPKLKSVPKPVGGVADDEGTADEPKERTEKRRTRERRDETARERRNDEDRPREREERRSASDNVRVTLCADTGLIAAASCPATYSERFTRGEAPGERCNLHSERESEPSPIRATSYRSEPEGERERDRERSRSRERESSSRDSGEDSSEFTRIRERSSEESPRRRRRSDEDREERPERRVRVSLCLTSGDRATRSCTDTIQRRLPSSQVPSGYCSLH